MVFSDPIYTLSRYFPDRIAVKFGDQHITYKRLHSDIEKVRLLLLNHDSWAVSYLIDDVYYSICVLWACIREKKVFVPINPKFPIMTVETILSETDSALLHSNKVNDTQCEDVPYLSLEQPVTLVCTSGSTGKSKYVVHSLQNHIASAFASNRIIPYSHGDTWLMVVPLFHVSGLSIVFRTFFSGASLAIPSHQMPLIEALNFFKPSHLSLVPTQLLALPNDVSLPYLNYLLLGGASVAPSLLERFSSRLPIYLTYGLTEMASQVVTNHEVLHSAEVKIDALSKEILVKGDSLCLGYFDKGFIRLLLDKDGWFHTKDRAQWNGSRFDVLGRLDRMFISGGENIYPEEIESVALQIPGVLLARVVPTHHDVFGQRPALYYYAKNEIKFSVMKGFFDAALPRYKHPETIDFVSELDLYIKKFRCK